jgi:hypothetical protein
MPVQIQIRNGTAAQWTSANPVLAAGEVGIETDTRKQKFGDGTTAWNSLAYAGGTGTVTGVTGTSPVVSSGGAAPAISLASGYGDTLNPYASKTANQVLAAPNGTSGVPSFRALVSADIPTLNQNTTGTAAGLSATLAIASGGTGATTAISAFNALAPSQSGNSGKYLTTDGTNSSWGTVSGGGSPALPFNSIQFNNSGAFGGDANLTWNGSTLNAAGFTGPLNGSIGAITPNSAVFQSTTHKGSTSGTVTITAPAVANTQSYTLPTGQPTANGQALTATTAGVMSWATAGGGTPGGTDTQVQFNDGGSTFGGDSGLTYNKTTDNLTVLGNLVIGTSGKGIDFSATPGTGTSELLADYEEGTFTPVVTGSTSGTVNGTGVYTKIGNLVYVCTSYNVTTGSAPVGTYSITGLPFASSSSIDIYPFEMAAFYGFGFDSSKILNAFVVGGTSVISLAQAVNNGASTDITAANFTSGSIYFRVSGSYRV